MDILTDVHTWALVLGILTPLAQSVVQSPSLSQRARVVVSVVAALVVGTVTVLANGQFDPADWFTTLGIVLAASQTAYGLVYRPTGLARVIELRTPSIVGRHKQGYPTDLAA